MRSRSPRRSWRGSPPSTATGGCRLPCETIQHFAKPTDPVQVDANVAVESAAGDARENAVGEGAKQIEHVRGVVATRHRARLGDLRRVVREEGQRHVECAVDTAVHLALIRHREDAIEHRLQHAHRLVATVLA